MFNFLPQIPSQPNQQQMVNMMTNFASQNPLFQRAQQMAQGKSEQELMQVAQNLCQQRGIDIQAAYQAFQQFGAMFGGKQ